ncbi:MAG: FkbM family methyltransferase [Betaproteobacteria bacterium]|nr:FkbM family methyltransferase [Betaproteobacteria bacterium]
MYVIDQEPIPDWLYDEVQDYFAIPIPFEPRTVLDIGANIGAFAQEAHSRWPNAHIICCEPMPFNVSRLRRNVHADALIISAAVRERSGVAEIFVGDNFVTGGFVQFGRQTQQTILVECIAAKDLPSCELVKIDTEGCEVEILKGLALQATSAVLLEYHSRADAETIKSLLSPAFRLVTADSGEALGTFVFFRR